MWHEWWLCLTKSNDLLHICSEPLDLQNLQAPVMAQRCHQFVHIVLGQVCQLQLLTFCDLGEEDLLLKFYHAVTVEPVSKDWISHSLVEHTWRSRDLLGRLVFCWSIIYHNILLWDAAASWPLALGETPATDQVWVDVPHQLFEWKWHHHPAWSVIDWDFGSGVLLCRCPNRFWCQAFHAEGDTAPVCIKHLYIPHCSLVAELMIGITSPLEEGSVVKEDPKVRGVSCIV